MRREIVATLMTVLSLCIADKHEANPSYVVIDGDLYIVVMLGLTWDGCKGIRYIYGYQYMEAVDLALSEINKHEGQFSDLGIKIGAIIMDDCSSAERGLKLTKEFYEGIMSVFDSNGTRIDPNDVVGFVGSANSDKTMKIAEYLNTTKTVLVAPQATSPQLSNRTRFPYFVRTVPSDDMQGPALAALLITLGWSSVHVVIEDGLSYSIDLARLFKEAFEKDGRCIPSTHYLRSNPHSQTETKSNAEEIIRNIMDSEKSDVILVLGGGIVKPLLAAKQKFMTEKRAKRLVFIGMETWGKTEFMVDGYENAAKGSITIALYGDDVKAFDDHMSKIRYGQTSARSVHTDMYFKAMFNCDTNCTTNMVVTNLPTYSQDTFILQTIHAVYALSIATTKRLKEKCESSTNSVCKQFGTSFGKEFTKAMENMTFTDIDGQEVTILNRESGNAYNFYYWEEDGTPVKIGSSAPDGKSFEADPEYSDFPVGYYTDMPKSDCPPKLCGYNCKRCKLNKKKLVSRCWDCKQTINKGYVTCDACVKDDNKFLCFNCR